MRLTHSKKWWKGSKCLPVDPFVDETRVFEKQIFWITVGNLHPVSASHWYAEVGVSQLLIEPQILYAIFAFPPVGHAKAHFSYFL